MINYCFPSTKPYNLNPSVQLSSYLHQKYDDKLYNISNKLNFLEELLNKLRKPIIIREETCEEALKFDFNDFTYIFLDLFNIPKNLFEKTEINEDRLNEIKRKLNLNMIFNEKWYNFDNSNKDDFENILLLSLFCLDIMSKIDKRIEKKDNFTMMIKDDFCENSENKIEQIKIEKKEENKSIIIKNINFNDCELYIKIIEEKMEEIENLKKIFNDEKEIWDNEKYSLIENIKQNKKENELLKEELEKLKDIELLNNKENINNRRKKYAIIDELNEKLKIANMENIKLYQEIQKLKNSLTKTETTKITTIKMSSKN